MLMPGNVTFCGAAGAAETSAASGTLAGVLEVGSRRVASAVGGRPSAVTRPSVIRHRSAVSVLALTLSLAAPARGAAQSEASATGLEFAGVPALNYDADEGFGYGVVLELYQYGSSGRAPYVYTVQPTVFLTTGGRRDVTVFFDAPHVVPGWRLDAYLGREQQIATPYYGIGNASVRVEALDEDDANPYWYRFGRTWTQVRLNVQRPVAPSIRVLLGGGMAHMTIDPFPKDTGTTLLAQDLGSVLSASAAEGGWSNYVRAGVIRDTRDREIGPRAGSWSELMIQRVDEVLGSRSSYTRWTVADRRYLSLGGPHLVFANRFLLQGVAGNAPFYDLYVVETSFKQQEGLGGAKTVRGMLKNRYVGKGLFLWNAELRARVAEYEMLGRRFHVVLNAFVDSGRVWADGPDLSTALTELHTGFGGGVRLGMGESFIVALDVGHGSEAAAAAYIGLGYLY